MGTFEAEGGVRADRKLARTRCKPELAGEAGNHGANRNINGGAEPHREIAAGGRRRDAIDVRRARRDGIGPRAIQSCGRKPAQRGRVKAAEIFSRNHHTLLGAGRVEYEAGVNGCGDAECRRRHVQVQIARHPGTLDHHDADAANIEERARRTDRKTRVNEHLQRVWVDGEQEEAREIEEARYTQRARQLDVDLRAGEIQQHR